MGWTSPGRPGSVAARHPVGMTAPLSRRALLAATAISSAMLLPSAAIAAPHRGRAPRFRVAIATNEPWGTYHVRPLLDEVASRGGTIRQVVPDLEGIGADEIVPVSTLEQLDPSGLDLLVVSGATDWPGQVARALPDLPVIASSLAYMMAVEGPHAAALRPRLVRSTASSEAEAETFAAHLGISAPELRVVGIPELDDLPQRAPEPGTVLAVTSVTRSDTTGGSAPGTELLLATAHALADQGRRVLVGLHPREDRSLWSDFEIAEEGTLAASARAEAAVGIPGSVFPKIAAVGTPLVGILLEGLEVPEHLLDICATASSLEESLSAVESAEPVDGRTLRRVIGPVGRAGETYAQILFAASQSVRRGR